MKYLNTLVLCVVFAAPAMQQKTQPTRLNTAYTALVVVLKNGNIARAEELLKTHPRITWGKHVLYHVRSPDTFNLLLQYDPALLRYPESQAALRTFKLDLWIKIAQNPTSSAAFLALADYCKTTGEHVPNIRKTTEDILQWLMEVDAPMEVVSLMVHILPPSTPTPAFVEYVQAKAHNQ